MKQARHEPIETVGHYAREHREWDVNGDAISVGAGFELIGERQAQVALGPRVGEERRVNGGGIGKHVLASESEEVRVSAPGFLPPTVEVVGGDDVLGNAFVVEVKELILGGHEARSALTGLQFFGLSERPLICLPKRMVRAPFAVDEGMADEEVARLLAVDAPPQHLAVRHDRHSIERDAFGRDSRTL